MEPRREIGTMDRDGSNDWTGNVRIDVGISQPQTKPTWLDRWSRLIAGHGSLRAVRVSIVIMMIAFSVAPLLNVARNELYNKDYDLWQSTGQIVLDGHDIYPRTPGPYPSCTHRPARRCWHP